MILYRNINRLSIGYALCGLTLGADSPHAEKRFVGNLGYSVAVILTLL